MLGFRCIHDGYFPKAAIGFISPDFGHILGFPENQVKYKSPVDARYDSEYNQPSPAQQHVCSPANLGTFKTHSPWGDYSKPTALDTLKVTVYLRE